jgi:anhydro-N-acetylmuramic acid kinase
MSGTSLDGISAAIVRFPERVDHASGRSGCELVAHLVRPYRPQERRRLERAIQDGATAAEWCQLGFDLGRWLADAANRLLEASGVPREQVRAIASHGQTVWHEPGHSTWQIGESAVIAEETGLDVVSDFRVRDVAAGGQGAPLVPMADAVLFASEREWRALQNLGGIGNLTIVPPASASRQVARGGGGRRTSAVVRAFDTGPGVMVIDGVVRALRPRLPYDIDGALARRTVADAYRRFVSEPVTEVLLSGGGARNPVLVEALVRALAPRVVQSFSDVYFDGEAKEPVAFALLGALHIAGRPGNLPSATGAEGPRVLGKMTPADAADPG